ncbi:cell wall metabolism sensor histidine kinase WalK [Cellulomonas sp. KRMCY2]|uniref:sensor histidine kinase n=1 Tax=Cellulomonas sp. KRMCY2 TaxID=1304865 RepID=UPI0004A22D1B|nr:histidine kinase dimerization/phospho-acceptor domain-containing protein [Cellulomonas sp. KRMCY2]
MAAVLLLAALALTIAGSTAYVLQVRRTDLRIDASLARAVTEIREAADTGVDPETAETFTNVSDLLYRTVQRRAPALEEGVIALVDGRPRWLAPRSTPLRLEDDEELIAELAALPTDGDVTLRTTSTPITQYRYVAVPVTMPVGGEQGLFVVAHDRGAEHASLLATFRTYVLVALASLLVIAVVGWSVVGRLLAPLRRVRSSTERITRSDLSGRIPVTGSDDVAAVAVAVNGMLDRLESAFDAQRRLLDDVGHELRTPLTIIQGHLELADPTDPDDVRTAHGIALDELDRMHRLVEDLMVLARAERPDFVRRAPVDLGRLTDDVLDKARTLGDRRWSVACRAEVVADVDGQRLTQAWLQLAANAVRFSGLGTAITIGSEADDGVLRLWVRDEGIGLAAAEAARVFERYDRGHQGVAADGALEPPQGRDERRRDARRSDARRTTDGAGIGLAIVAAIAAAHQGTARWEQPDGPGARFVIELSSGTPGRDSTTGPARHRPTDD